MSIVSRNYRTLAALAVACFAFVTHDAGAANLLIKRADGSTATPIPLTSSNGCTVVADGDIEVRPQAASGVSNDGWCPEGAAPALPTVTLSVTPLSIQMNQSVSATWTTTGATSCTGSATIDNVGSNISGWTGARPVSQGAPGLSITLTQQGAYVFSLTCTNSSGSTTGSSLTVTVGNQPPPDGCEAVTPSFGLTRQTTMVNTGFMQGNGEHPNGPLAITAYNVVSGPFPSRQGTGTIAVKNMQFAALEFNTGTATIATYGQLTSGLINKDGGIIFGIPSEFPGLHLAAISSCPGDFNNLPNSNSFCRLSAPGTMLNWTVGNALFACKLAENTRYYLNLAFVDFAGGGSSTCQGEGMSSQNATACRMFLEMR